MEKYRHSMARLLKKRDTIHVGIINIITIMIDHQIRIEMAVREEKVGDITMKVMNATERKGIDIDTMIVRNEKAMMVIGIITIIDADTVKMNKKK